MLAIETKPERTLEAIPCLICGSEQQEPAFQAPNRFDLQAGDVFQIVRCARCAFVFLNPRPPVSAVERFYASADYQPFVSAQLDRKPVDRLYGFFRSYMVSVKRRKIERFHRTGSLLDVGCGTGEFLHEMQTHGWQVAGIERDEAAARYASDAYDLEISSADLTENKYLKKSYDVVTLWHVLEHLYRPLAALQLIRQALNRDGIVLVAVPNVSSFDARFYRGNWVALDAPRHLHHFTSDSLRSLALQAGLEIFGIRQLPLDAAYNCLMSEFLLEEKGLSSRFLLPFYMMRAVSVALMTIVTATRIRTESSRRGSSMLYFMKRSESSR